MIAGASPSPKRTLPVRSPWISCERGVDGPDRGDGGRARCLTSGISRALELAPRPRDRRSPRRRLVAQRKARPLDRAEGEREDDRRRATMSAQRRSSCRPSSHGLAHQPSTTRLPFLARRGGATRRLVVAQQPRECLRAASGARPRARVCRLEYEVADTPGRAATAAQARSGAAVAPEGSAKGTRAVGARSSSVES